MKENVTNRQIAFLIFNGIVGYGVLSLPKNTTEISKTGAWISLIIATFVVLISGYIFTYLGYVFKGKTIYEYTNTITGKHFKNIIIPIYIFYFFCLFTFISRISSEIISLTILIKTPAIVFNLILLIVVYYGVTKKLKNIGRICELYGMIIIIGALIVHTFISTQGKLLNIRPFIPPLGIKTYFKSIFTTTFAFLAGVEIICIVPFNKKINNKKIFKYVLLMISFIGFLYIYTVESCISVLGVNTITKYNDALLATVRRINIRFLEFLSRLDGLVLILWLMAVFTTLLLNNYATTFLINKYFKKTPFNKIALIVTCTSFFIAQIPKTLDNVRKTLDYVSYLSILTILIIPLILFIITKVKKYDKKV